MANILDVAPIGYLTPLLVWVFVFVVLFAIMEKFRMFGESQGTHALIAVIFSLIFILVRPLRELVLLITPWFVILFIVMIVMLIAVMIFGVKQDAITTYISDNPGVTVTVIVFIILIFLAGITNVFPDSTGFPEDDDGTFTNVRSVIFHPKVLGVFFLLIVASFVVRTVGFIKK